MKRKIASLLLEYIIVIGIGLVLIFISVPYLTEKVQWLSKVQIQGAKILDLCFNGGGISQDKSFSAKEDGKVWIIKCKNFHRLNENQKQQLQNFLEKNLNSKVEISDLDS